MDRDEAHDRRSGVACDPVVLDDWMPASEAIVHLAGRSQAMAFVATGAHLSAVVTVHDLEFACEWAGPEATVADAAACALVDVAAGSTPAEAARAFSEAAARWHQLAHVRTVPASAAAQRFRSTSGS